MREGIITQQDKAACLQTTVAICQCQQYWCFPVFVPLGILESSSIQRGLCVVGSAL